MRINIVGTSGCDKSTVGKHIAERLNVPYIYLDELHWKPIWAESPDEELFPKLEKALSPDEKSGPRKGSYRFILLYFRISSWNTLHSPKPLY